MSGRHGIGGIAGAWRRWLADERGSVTMEFVVWIPFLLFWFVVSVVYFDAFKSRNDTSKAAHTMSDILSRQSEVTQEFLDQLFALQANLLPRAPEGSWMRISSIQYDATEEEHVVVWSESVGRDEPLLDENIRTTILPAMADLDTVVLTELFVPYFPFADWVGFDARIWTIAIVARPRFVSAIAREGFDDDDGIDPDPDVEG